MGGAAGGRGVGPLGPELVRSVERALSTVGRPGRVVGAAAMGGGCVNPSARVETDRGVCFLKWNAEAPVDVFEAEAEGLSALRAAGAPHGIVVPEVLAVGGARDGEPAWLLLDFVERGAGGGGWGVALGRGLAGLHGTSQAGAWGWERDNYIGPLPQENAPTEGWSGFWRDRRLAPQLELARRRGHFRGEEATVLERLLGRVDEALSGAEADGPSLLHGDLWSGNAYPRPGGDPVLVDPAPYRGHREVDLAMSELFGGFPAGFLEAYDEAWPLDDAYRRIRRPLYQLYYLLVHVNLFGGGYARGSVDAARGVLAAL